MDGSGSAPEARPARSRRRWFTALTAVVVVVFGVGFFGLTSLFLGWFESRYGVAGPVTDLGYGALYGIILTMGLLVQLRSPERKIAGVQQAALVIPALLVASVMGSDFQSLMTVLVLVPTLAVLWFLHPSRGDLLRRGGPFSPELLAIAVLASIPLIGYALTMGRQARDLPGPPHHVLRLVTMAALAIAVVFTGLLASLQTRGWRIPAWSAGAAAVVFGLASVAFPDHPGAAGRGWGAVSIAGGVLFVGVAEWRARRTGRGIAPRRR